MSVLYTGGGTSSGTTQIPEYTSDPVSPSPTDVWVLRTALLGTPIGLLLSLTYSADIYQLSYRTTEGLTVRTTLQ